VFWFSSQSTAPQRKHVFLLCCKTKHPQSGHVSGTDTDSMVEFKTQENGEPVQYYYDGETVYKES